MRIIAGYAKGRQIKSIPGFLHALYLKKVRGAIFNILRNEIMEKEILDLYSEPKYRFRSIKQRC